MMRPSLSTNLLLWAILMLVGGLACVLGSWALIAQIQPQWLRDRELRHMWHHFDRCVSVDSMGRAHAIQAPGGLQPVLEAMPGDVFYQLLDGEGKVLLSSNKSTVAFLPDSTLPKDSRGIFQKSRDGIALSVVLERATQAETGGFLLVARSDRFYQTLLDNDNSNERFAAMTASAASIVAFAIAVLITIRGLLTRLRRISEAASRIDRLNLKARLALDDAPKELLPLIDSFNGALARLESGFRIQQDFLATVAHELKTPLALIRGEVELDGPKSRPRILADLDHIIRQVNQLLHLAEVSDSSALSKGPIDAAAVVRDAVDFVSRLAEARHIHIQILEDADSPFVRADASALFVLMRNLIENAVHHAPDGSMIDVGVERRGLWVRDEGRGVAVEDIPNLFKRFWRGAHRRDSGAGLGLSICEEIARGHGWTLSVRNVPDSGAEFRVDF